MREPTCLKVCPDDRKHIWASNPSAAHEVSSGQALWAKPGRSHYTSGFCPSMNYHPLSALHSAFFKQATLSHHKCFSGNHREALIPFPKITSGTGKGQRGGVCRPFCRSFKYPGIDPIKRIMKEKQTAKPLVFSLVSLSLSNFCIYKNRNKDLTWKSFISAGCWKQNFISQI